MYRGQWKRNEQRGALNFITNTVGLKVLTVRYKKYLCIKTDFV